MKREPDVIRKRSEVKCGIKGILDIDFFLYLYLLK